MHIRPADALVRAKYGSGAARSAPMRVAVVVASISRSEEIGQLLQHLAQQTCPPSAIVLSVERESDLPGQIDPSVHVIMGPRGLPVQRNRGMEYVLQDCDIVVFFDDDFLPTKDGLADIARLFEENEDIVGATGEVLSDGVKRGGVPYDEAVRVLAEHEQGVRETAVMNVDTDAAYGCNMAFRTAAIGDCRFDEKLPLYAWQEDVDFTGQLLAKGGRIVKTTAFSGVHRGVSKGRSPGFALGYSQMANPVYLVRKGTMRRPKALRLMLQNFIANHARVLFPEPLIDRAGRSRGNWLGLWHILTGKSDPSVILRLR
jgi:GT2 family glycosyltransferase